MAPGGSAIHPILPPGSQCGQVGREGKTLLHRRCGNAGVGSVHGPPSPLPDHFLQPSCAHVSFVSRGSTQPGTGLRAMWCAEAGA